MGHRQKGKGGKRKRSWHRRGAGPDWAWMRAVKRLEGAGGLCETVPPAKPLGLPVEFR